MTSITIDLTDDQVASLREVAARLGMSLEEVVLMGVRQVLTTSDEDFRRAADHVLDKNADLYRRLA